MMIKLRMNVTQTMISWVKVKVIHPPHAASARIKLGIQSRKPSIKKTLAIIGRFDIYLRLRVLTNFIYSVGVVKFCKHKTHVRPKPKESDSAG